MLPGPSHPNPSAYSQPKESEAALEALGQVVLKDDQNLVIWRQDSEAMWRTAQALQNFWRTTAPAVALEQFTGQQRLDLLGHINQGIAQLGLAQAMQKPLPDSLPQQISIITNAEQLPAADVQMLQDLTQHLPGLRWRWVLLGLDPSAGQNSAAIPGMNPCEPGAQWMAVPGLAAPATLAASSPLADPLNLASVSPATEAVSIFPSKKPSRRLAWLSLAALLGLGAWGTASHFFDANSVPSQADKPAAAATPAASASASASDSAPSLEAPPQPSASDPQPTASAASNTPPSQTQDQEVIAVPAEPAAPPQAPVAADTRNKVPEIALQGVRWLALQSPEFFVLEHGAFQTAAQAQSLIRSREELANARVLMRKTADPSGRFVVVTGPFRSQERAQNYKVRAKLAPQIQVRKVSDVLQESVRTAPARP
jgi:hypothetical protein